MLIAPAAPPLTATLPAGCWPPTSNVVPPDTGAAPVPYVPSGCWPPTSNDVPPEPASPLTTTVVAAHGFPVTVTVPGSSATVVVCGSSGTSGVTCSPPPHAADAAVPTVSSPIGWPAPTTAEASPPTVMLP